MTDERKIIDHIIHDLSEGQDPLIHEIQNSLEEGMDTRMEVYYMTAVFIRHPEKTNWKLLFDKIENLILDETQGIQCEIIYQELLETISNAISNGRLSHEWVTPVVGKLARNYIEEYDAFMGGKTPGF